MLMLGPKNEEHAKGNDQWNHNLNVKLQFTADKLDRLWIQVCEAHNSPNVEHDHDVCPTQGVRGLLRRDDVYATYFGQVLAVTPCTQVRPEVIYWNRTVNSTCFEEVPVRFNNSLWFVQGGTQDLKREGRKIDCGHRRQSVYSVNLRGITTTVIRPMLRRYRS